MKISIDGSGRVCEVREGETLLSALARGGVVISAPCGGQGTCGKCTVKLLEGSVSSAASGRTPEAGEIISACRVIPRADTRIALLGNDRIPGNWTDGKNGAGEAGFSTKPGRAGLALDIGTTTVSARLIDLTTGGAVDTISLLNDQRVFGADVMSRINAARQGRTPELFSRINRQTRGIFADLLAKHGPAAIEKLVVSGNTTMLHLFAGVDPSGMGEAPFSPVFLREREFSGAELFLPAGRTLLLPSISAFLGGDVTAGLAALNILEEEGPALLLDIGTNGEMALFHRGHLFCCSTAAGPAFEGAEISCGTGSVRGAVNRVSLSGGAVHFTVIGGEEPDGANPNGVKPAAPRGICGSGLIDAIALMRKTGIIDESGAFQADAGAEFTITPGISITQRDVRQFQLAKSAILSGIRILCRNAGLGLDEVKRVFIAGGLGFFIDPQNAVVAGLLPVEFPDRIVQCGNVSLRGAALCLTDGDFLSNCRNIIENCRVADLASDPAFTDEFMENMSFP
jgi:uncharacterized 2Fe-2S/4Fe-4S cluster protein (DUF4445 family)